MESRSAPMPGSVSSHSIFETLTPLMRVTPSVPPASKSLFVIPVGRKRKMGPWSCVTVQPDDCVALALQQHGERSALRKGHNVVSFCFSFSKGWTIFAGIPFIPATGSL